MIIDVIILSNRCCLYCGDNLWSIEEGEREHKKRGNIQTETQIVMGQSQVEIQAVNLFFI